MAEIDDLISQVGDDKLRAELTRAAKALRANKKFGLVYERHLPETIFIPVDGRVAVGAQVVVRTEPDNATRYVVDKVNRTHATISEGETTRKVRHRDLLVVKPFGEPVFPVLRPYGAPVVRGGDKPFHTVINGENFHALQLLLFGYEGKVDCIYIDPPYNSRARDWKYNNDYVDLDDSYRHSKWLSMMEKRLRLAKRLLNPDKSVLIVTIDEKEYLRAGLLLEDVFRDCRVQMVSITINPKGTARANEFSRVDEFAFFVTVGSATIDDVVSSSDASKVRWRYLRREDIESARGTVKGGQRQFYPIYVDRVAEKIVHIGAPLSPEAPLDVPEIEGATAVFPIREDGTHMNWGLTGPSLQKAIDEGYARATPGNEQQPYVISYLTAPNIAKVRKGELIVSGERPDGSKIVTNPAGKSSRPTTVWRDSAHDAGSYGTSLLRELIPGRKFPFPKSLYAVEDCLRLVVGANREALVIDFFSGSGTTVHAVARLNRQDGGHRQAILVTNNEVSDDERQSLVAGGHAPGDEAWEDLGIFRHITVPRVTAALTGTRPDGTPLAGDYKFADEFPMAEGLEENAVFLELGYADPDAIETGKRFEDVLPALWLAAGAVGDVTQMKATSEWFMDPAANFAVLLDEDRFAAFRKELAGRSDLTHVWLVTNSSSSFARMSSKVPDGVHVGMLYRDYLRNFRTNTGESV
jgi:adenine-specific DNA-methyltransferase